MQRQTLNSLIVRCALFIWGSKGLNFVMALELIICLGVSDLVFGQHFYSLCCRR
jgi:hypothetical protein